MKNNSILTYLLGFFLLASTFLCIKLIFQSRELRGLTAQIQNANLYRANMQALMADCLEYSKTHPGIDPLLQQVGLKPSTAATKPVTK